MNDKKISGKTAPITGASKGLGRAMALALAQAGSKIALVSRDREKLEGVAAEIREAGGEAHVFVADVAKESDVQRVEKEVSAALGKIQILVNNAGINIRKKITDLSWYILYNSTSCFSTNSNSSRQPSFHPRIGQSRQSLRLSFPTQDRIHDLHPADTAQVAQHVR